MKIGPAVRMLMPIITQFGKTATKKLKKRGFLPGPPGGSAVASGDHWSAA
jgi:hypothetical protein